MGVRYIKEKSITVDRYTLVFFTWIIFSIRMLGDSNYYPQKVKQKYTNNMLDIVEVMCVGNVKLNNNMRT